tara:strand:- start:7795 stop:10155 length:2361 start_codon:yes stop_codon:yes gene_type:complete
MAKLGDLVVNIGANTKKLNDELGKVRRSMRSMSNNFTAVGKSMTRSITMPLALVGGAAVKLAVEFESAMAQVKAVSGATGSEFKKLEQSAKDLGASTVFTAREVAALQLEYSRLGFSADEIIQVQEATLNLAQATGSDLAQAAEVAGATLRAYGMDAAETGKVTDIMAASFSASALNIDTFQDSMKFVAPIAKAAGVSIEETSAMLAVLANSGIKGSQAGTALRRIMQEMQGTTGTLSERFAELAAKGIGLEGSMDEVGRRAATSLLVLTNGAGQVNELTGSFKNSEGAAKSMADVMNNTAEGGLKAMSSALEGAGIALGEVLIPFVTKAANFIRELATDFKNLSLDTQSTIVKTGLLVSALGPLLIILPKITGGISELTSILGKASGGKGLIPSLMAMANPITIAVASIGGIILAMKQFGDETTRTFDTLSRVTDKIKELPVALNSLDLPGLLGEVNTSLDGVLNTAQDFEDMELLTSLGANSEDLSTAINLSKKRISELKAEIDELTNSERINTGVNGELEGQLTSTAMKGLKLAQEKLEAYTRAMEAATLAAEMLADNGVAKVNNELLIVPERLDAIGPSLITLGGLTKELQTSTASIAAGMTDWINPTTVKFAEFSNSVHNSMKSAAVAMISGVGSMIGSGKSLGEALLGPLAAMAVQLGEIAIGYGIAISGIKKALKSLSPGAAIVAGVALVALGSGLQSAISRASEENLPALAEGGLAFGPTTALVGDNKNAGIDPEVIAPLSKLKDMIGGGATNVYGRISGDDIVISNDRAARDRNRYV